MNYIYGKKLRTVRTTILNVVTSAVLLGSSLGTAVPLLLSQKAFAATLDVCTTGCTYTSIQSAITAANVNDTITVGAGTYNESGLNLNKAGLKLIGQAGAKIVVPNSTEVNGISITADNVTVSGFEIAGPVNLPYTAYNWGSNISRGVAVSNGVQNFTVTNDNIHDVRNGILIDGRNTGTMTGNTIDNTKGAVSVQYTDGSDITMTGNHQGANGNDWGVNLHLNGHFVGDTAFSTGQKIAADAPVAAQQVIRANSAANDGWSVQDQGYSTSNRTNVNVSTTGTASGQGDPLGPLNSVQSGVDAVITDGTVKVAAGTYAGGVNISDGVNLIGANAGVSGTSPSRGAETIINSGNPAIRVSATDPVMIDGFTFDGTGTPVDSYQTGNDVTIQNTVIKNTTDGGNLFFNSPAKFTFKNNYLTNLDPNSNEGAQIAGSWDGHTGTVVDIEGNSWKDSQMTGLNLSSVSGTISGNSFNNIAYYGVLLANNSSSLSVTNNTFDHITNPDPSVTTYGAGIRFYTPALTGPLAITGNTFGNSPVGIAVRPSDNISGMDIQATSNSFTNDTKGVDNEGTGLFKATTNWWGDASGPKDTNASDGSTPASNNAGTGSAAFGAVNYGPWCVTADCSTYSDASLAAPTNLTPADGSFTNNPAFNDTWSPVAGATKYEYRTSNAESGGNLGTIIYHDDSTSSNYDVTPTLVTRHNNGTPEGDYYWQVRAVNAEGTGGPWSVINKVTVDTTKPADVTITPAGGSVIHGPTTFTVTDSDAHPSYIYVELNHNGNWITDNTHDGTEGATTSTLTYDASTLADGTYTIKVDAVDKAGNTTEKTYNYTVDNTAPAVPTLLSPADGIYRQTNDSNFSEWSSVTDANGPVTYYYESAFDAGFTNIAYGPHAQTDTKIFNPGEPETTYYWRVQACDSVNNCSDWSAARTIHVDNTAPSVPTNGLPNNSVETTNEFDFTWDHSTDASPVTYEFQSTQNPTQSGGVLTTGLWQSGTLNDATIHSSGAGDGPWYWQVRAKDAAGNTSNWSSIWKVTLDTATLSAPTLIAPSNGASVNGASVTNSWSSVSDATKYEYQSFNDAAGTNQRFDDTFTGTSKTATNVADGTTFYWRVRAIDQYGQPGAWSNGGGLWKVTIDNTAPAVPANLRLTANSTNTDIPNGSSTNSLSVTANWNSVADADHYQYKIWTDIPTATNNSEASAWIVDESGTSQTGTFNEGDGVHHIEVRAVDAAGNASAWSAQFIVTYDTVPPATTVADETTSDTTPSVVGTVDDPAATVTAEVNGHTYTATVDSIANISGTYDWSADVTNSLAVGSHTVTATATDVAGNPATVTGTLTISAAPVTPTITTTNIQVTNFVQQFALTGSATSIGNTGTGNTQTGNATNGNTTQAVLGASTDKANTGSTGKVKGANVVNLANADNKGSFLALGWWWLAILAAAGFFFALAKRSSSDDKQS